MATSSTGSHVGKVLELKSPFGEEIVTYKWPLKKGKGSVRRSEVRNLFKNLIKDILKVHFWNLTPFFPTFFQDKEDEAGEILETIRWVCTDHPDIEETLDKNGALMAGKFNPTSFEAMDSLCTAYNKAVDKSLANKVCKLVIFFCNLKWLHSN